MSEMTLNEFEERFKKLNAEGFYWLGDDWCLTIGRKNRHAPTLKEALEIAEGHAQKPKYKFEGPGFYPTDNEDMGTKVIAYWRTDSFYTRSKIIGPRINFDEQTGEIK